MSNAVVLGTFDGLHKGHQSVIAAGTGFERIAVTFEVPPKAVMSDGGNLLMTPDARYKALSQLGVKEVVPLNFSDVRQMSAEDFLDMIYDRFSPKLISCGFNYRFGAGAKGDTKLLQKYCSAHGIVFRCSPPVTENGVTVSSSMIRDMIKNGESAAFKMVYGGFSITAPVIGGDRRGRTIGFPTANQQYPKELVCPRAGVYAVKVLFDGKVFDGISNIGHRPTYRTDGVFCETYIKDFSGDIYGKNITLKPIKFIREERKFSTLSELKAAISADVRSLSQN